MSAREEIFGSVRRSLGVTGKEQPRREAVNERIAKAPRGIVPERGHLSGEALLALFEEQAKATLATIDRVKDRAAVPEAIASQRAQRPQGSGVGPGLATQLSERARMRALEVLPVPRGPLNR